MNARKVFLILFPTLLLVHEYILCSSRLFPFVDLPDHLATATIMRYFHAPGLVLSEYYSLGGLFLKPNSLHLLFCSWSLFPDVEFANRVWYALYAVLTPLSILLVIRAVGGSAFWALGSFLLMYNMNVSWGFAGFTMGIPLLFLLVYAFILYVRRGGVLLYLFQIMLLILLFLTHALMCVVAISTLAICIMVFYGTRLSAAAKHAVIFAPTLILIVRWWALREVSPAGAGFFLPLAQYYAHTYLADLPGRVRLVFLDNYALSAGWAGYAVGAVFSGVTLIPLMCAARSMILLGKRPIDPMLRVVIALVVWPLVCFFLLPDQVFNFQIMYQRFSAIFLLSALVFLSVALPTPPNWYVYGVLAPVLVAHTILWFGYFGEFNQRNHCFAREFFPPAVTTSATGALVYDVAFRGKPVYVHMPSYSIVWTKGPATFRIVDFVDFAPPLRRKAGGKAIPVYKEWEWRHASNSQTYAGLDYLLVRGPAKLPQGLYTEAFTPINRCNEWLLLQRTQTGN